MLGPIPPPDESHKVTADKVIREAEEKIREAKAKGDVNPVSIMKLSWNDFVQNDDSWMFQGDSPFALKGAASIVYFHFADLGLKPSYNRYLVTRDKSDCEMVVHWGETSLTSQN